MILALDLATNFGWCKGDGTRLPQSGSIRLPSTGDDVGRFLSAYKSEFVELCQGVTKVVFEAPILPQTTSFKTVRKLQGLAGLTELFCYRATIPCFEASSSSWKKNLLGDVKIPRKLERKEKKQFIIDRVVELGFETKDSDEADAIGLWFHLMVKGQGRAACDALVASWKETANA